MSPDDIEVEGGSATAKKGTGRVEAEPPVEGQEAKYRRLRANPKKRRGLYVLIIFLALVAVAVALVDILILRADKDTASFETGDRIIEYVVYGLIVLLLLWAFFMLFSRRRGEDELAETAEQMQQRLEMERTLMQCPDCKSVFQYGEIHFRDNKRTAFSCPVCGVYSRLPDPTMEPVKVLRPEGEFKELQYHCSNCGEDMAVGTFGETPLHLVRFRACPSCGERGHIERVGSMPPMGVGPAPEDGGFAAA
jgi:Zn finger protein HypA/HybF involved in hydrogenase expression